MSKNNAHPSTAQTIAGKKDVQELSQGNNHEAADPKRGNENTRTNYKNQYRNEGLSGR